MIPKWNRRPSPVRWRFGELDDRSQMRSRPDGVSLTIDQRSSSSAENSAGTFRTDSAGTSPRSTIHLPTWAKEMRTSQLPPSSRSAVQRDHRARGHQVARAVVDRRRRIELGSRRLARNDFRLPRGDAADALNDRVEAAARCPGTGMPEGAQRDIHQPRPQRRQFLGRQSAGGQRARPVALREHVRLPHQITQRIDISAAPSDRDSWKACRGRYRIPGSRGSADEGRRFSSHRRRARPACGRRSGRPARG